MTFFFVEGGVVDVKSNVKIKFGKRLSIFEFDFRKCPAYCNRTL